MRVLIAQNTSREKLGLIEYVLKERRAEFDIVDLNEKNFPELSGYDVIFVLGGPDSANDKTSKMIMELKKIKEIVSLQISYLGVCLGMQTLVKATGGEVYQNPVPEIGCKDNSGAFYEVLLTENGIRDPIFTGIEPKFKIFQLHGETVKLVDSMKLLGTGKDCKNQIIKVGNNAYGIQGHLEVTEPMLKNWLAEDTMFDCYDKNAILKDFRNAQMEYKANGLRLINNFLDIAEKQNEEMTKINLNN